MDILTASVALPGTLLAWMECLADPTRVRLLRLLERHELGVADLCDVVQLKQSTVSRHLKVLSDQDWSRNRRQGTNNLYRMVLDELDPAARKLWLFVRDQTTGWATARQDELRLRQLLHDKQTDSQAFFATAAAKWDKLRDELYGRNFTNSAMLALLPADWVVGDLACGTGQTAVQLARCVRQVIAVDNSAAMLKAARRRTADLSNVDLRRGDLESLPIEDAACDAVLVLLALTYVQEPSLVVREMARVLKPGGRAVIIDLLPHDREDFRVEMGQARVGLEPTSLEQVLKEIGFTTISSRLLSAEPNVKGPALFLTIANRNGLGQTGVTTQRS